MRHRVAALQRIGDPVGDAGEGGEANVEDAAEAAGGPADAEGGEDGMLVVGPVAEEEGVVGEEEPDGAEEGRREAVPGGGGEDLDVEGGG